MSGLNLWRKEKALDEREKKAHSKNGQLTPERSTQFGSAWDCKAKTKKTFAIRQSRKVSESPCLTI